MEYLSDIELYICSIHSVTDNEFEISGEEFHHAVNVMRNKIGGQIFATNGIGKIFAGKIIEIGKENLKAEIFKFYSYENELENFTFCIPNLKNPERLKFALEKCTELGVTDFIIFNSERTLNKTINLSRLEKIVLAAMKQSLRSFIPTVKIAKSIIELIKDDNELIIFDQSSKRKLNKFNFDRRKHYLFIFGPEGSLSENELKIINTQFVFNLGNHRLRSETAIVKCASVLSLSVSND